MTLFHQLTSKMNEELVLEILVRHIVCRNRAVQSSPMVVNIPGSPSVMLNCKSAAIGKITYDRGKRLTFNSTHLQNLKVSFILVQGHGNHTVRASCTFDFFTTVSSTTETVPTVYDVEIGMDRPAGDRFGVLSFVFQLMKLSEFRDLLCAPTRMMGTTARASAVERNPPSPVSGRRISVTKQTSPRQKSRSMASVQELPLLNASGARPPSIHERYIRRNEMWIGHHFATHTEGDRARSQQGSRSPTSNV
jgi:hypothetical protein